MRLYAILKYIAGNSADSMSVGKMLGLRIATLYGGTQGNQKVIRYGGCSLWILKLISICKEQDCKVDSSSIFPYHTSFI